MGVYIPGITAPIEEVYEGPGEYVVLLDGLAHDGRDLRPMARFLQDKGYHCVIVGYPSTRLSVPVIATEYMPERFEKYLADRQRPVNFVTHSMGGIILRQYLHSIGLARLARAVMIAPPNHGSPVAEHLHRYSAFRWYFGPAGCSLNEGEASVPLHLPAADFDVGVIAGDLSLDPWFDPLFDGPHDGKVSVESARLEGMRDFRVVHYSHYGIHRQRSVYAMVLAYLHNGSFHPF